MVNKAKPPHVPVLTSKADTSNFEEIEDEEDPNAESEEKMFASLTPLQANLPFVGFSSFPKTARFLPSSLPSLKFLNSTYIGFNQNNPSF